MGDSNADYIFENLVPDSISLKKSSLKTNYSTITDITQGQNYQSGLVNYTNVSLQSTDDGSFFDLSNAFAQVQMTYTLTITNGTFLDASSNNPFPSNINAVTKKSDSHFIHNSWIKMAGIEVTQNNGAGYQNLYINEKKKQRNPNLSYLDNEMEQFYLDSADSYQYDGVSLEANNSSDTAGTYNKAIYQRNKYYFDIVSSPLLKFVNTASMAQYYYPYFQNATTANPSQLQWFDVLTIPLRDIHDIFEKAPPLLRLSGMEVKIQYNAGSAVSYTCTLNTANDAIATENVIMGNGGTFPLMLSSVGNTGTSALRFTPLTAGTACTFTLTCQIGWASNVSPTRILIPYFKLSENTLTKISDQRIYKFPVRHCELDTTINGVTGNSNVVRVLNTHYRSIRKIWLLPFFSTQNTLSGTNILAPYQNPRSSAPNTISVLRLKNVNISVGGRTYFSQESLNTPAQFYNENFYRLNSQNWSTGNQTQNPLKSGMILKSDWLKCYGAYEFDLNTCDTDAEDLTLKSIGLSFLMDGMQTYKYDFYILIECEKNYTMDAIECTLQDLTLVTQG